eukprot:1195108-Prorocentrum_minimum.AAC.7
MSQRVSVNEVTQDYCAALVGCAGPQRSGRPVRMPSWVLCRHWRRRAWGRVRADLQPLPDRHVPDGRLDGMCAVPGGQEHARRGERLRRQLLVRGRVLHLGGRER